MKAKIVYTNHINWKMIFTQQLFYQQIKTANEYVGVWDRLYFPATSSGLLPCILPQNNECIFSSSVRAFLLSYMVCVTNHQYVYAAICCSLSSRSPSSWSVLSGLLKSDCRLSTPACTSAVPLHFIKHSFWLPFTGFFRKKFENPEELLAYFSKES